MDDEGLCIIDQHVAHERVLFERIMERLTNDSLESQRLLIPAVLELPPAERAALVAKSEALARFGFEVEEFGGDSIKVTAMPALLDPNECDAALRALAEDLEGLDRGLRIEDALKQIAATTACHAAVKAHYPLTLEKMHHILEELRATAYSTVCPHGRPVMLRITRREIEKNFDRSRPRRRWRECMKQLTRHLYFWVLLAILVGGTIGYVSPETGVKLKPLGDGFIALVKMLIAPIIFCTVVLGIAGAGNMKKVGRVGGKALLYFEVVSTFALVIGLIVANVIQPGAGFNADPASLDAKAVADYAKVAANQSTVDFILHIIPRTFFDAFTGSGDLLQVLFVAVLFGYAMTHLGAGRQHRPPGDHDQLARLLPDDERADEAGAARRRRRDGVHDRPLWRRGAEAAGVADGQLLPDVPAVRVHRARHRSRRSPASASSASSPTSRTNC